MHEQATATKARLGQIQALRALFLQESNIQIRYDAYHERRWTDSYLLVVDGRQVGYGAIKGRERADRDTIFEFFVIPPLRKLSSRLFRTLIQSSAAKYVECQSNEPCLSALAFEFASDISGDVVLFGDHSATEHVIPGAVVRPRRKKDQVFDHTTEPVGDFVVDVGGDIVATGGFLLHYNFPFADLYMEVRPDCRRRGFASLLLQEVKKECYLAGRVPAARTGVQNVGSRGALRKAGLRECGFLLTGTLRPLPSPDP